MDTKFYHGNMRIGEDHFSFPHKPGDTLPNGAILIAESSIEEHGTGSEKYRLSTVLCLNPGAAQPYVTWRRRISADRTATGSYHLTDYCFTGQYTAYLDHAIGDFNHR